MIGHDFARDQFWGRNHENVFDALRALQGFNETNVNQMAVARLLNLKQTITFAFANHAHADGNVKAFAEMRAHLFRKFGGARRHEIDVLRHAGLSDVSIYGGGAKYNRIVAPAPASDHG